MKKQQCGFVNIDCVYGSGSHLVAYIKHLNCVFYGNPHHHWSNFQSDGLYCKIYIIY